MKITQNALGGLTMAVVFFCFLTPLSYSADKIDASSREALISIINLTNESSANLVTQNNGVIEFRGNELVASVTATMAASGTLPPGSTLALPDTKSMMIDVKATATPLALVEKDLQAGKDFAPMNLNALSGDATKIARQSIGIPLSDITRISTQGVPSVAGSQGLLGVNNNPGVSSGKGKGSGSVGSGVRIAGP